VPNFDIMIYINDGERRCEAKQDIGIGDMLY
jgi:hypothetical protein